MASKLARIGFSQTSSRSRSLCLLPKKLSLQQGVTGAKDNLGISTQVCSGDFSFSTMPHKKEDTISSGNLIESASFNQDTECIETTWFSEGKEANLNYPAVWLRDNCQCPQCFHPWSIARLALMKNMNVNCRPAEIHTTAGELRITWDDGHLSTFTSEWLYERRFTEDSRESLARWSPRKAVTWNGSTMQENIPTENFDNIISSDLALYDWLCQMEDSGLFLIKNAPCAEPTETESLAIHQIGKRVAFLKTTNYGPNFTVKAKVKASNAAYTPVSLGLHTDLPYYQYCPGVQMLSCLKQVPTKGGENQFADGFYAAEVMREQYPEEFKLLTTVPVRFFDIGSDYYEYYKLFSTPVITLAESGRIERVTYNDQVRDSVMPIPAEDVAPFYRALKLFNTILYDNHVRIKLGPGDIICFHNYRVLHGRTGFEVLGDGERHLEGGYIDWDEMFSRRRVLQRKLGL